MPLPEELREETEQNTLGELITITHNKREYLVDVDKTLQVLSRIKNCKINEIDKYNVIKELKKYNLVDEIFLEQINKV